MRMLFALTLVLQVCSINAADFFANFQGQVVENRVNSTVIFDQMLNQHVEKYGAIQPEFVAAVLNGPLVKEVLEICGGHGFVVQEILQAQSPGAPDVNYSVVEMSSAYAQKIKDKWNAHNKRPESNRIEVYNDEVVAFLTADLDKKLEHYDLVFAGSAFPILAPFEYVKTLDGLFKAMKEGGKLFLTQHSTRLGKYHPNYVKNVQAGELLPFWADGSFYSDPETTKKILNDFGFEIEHIGLYRDHYVQNNYAFGYVGAIARKKGSLRNEEKVSRYHNRAMEKFRETCPEHMEASVKEKLFKYKRELKD